MIDDPIADEIRQNNEEHKGARPFSTVEPFTLNEAVERGKEWAPRDPITRTLIEGVGELQAINRDMLAALEGMHAFTAVMFGRGPDAIIPETVNAPKWLT
jgi:hypothetical protein